MTSALRSVRARWTAWYVVVTAIFLAAFGLSAYSILLRNLSRTTDRSLILTAETFARAVRHEANDAEDVEGEDELVAEEAGDFAYADRLIMIFRPDGTAVPPANTRSAAHTPVETLRPFILQKGSVPGFTTVEEGSGGGWRVFVFPLRVRARDYVMAVGRSTSDQRAFLQGLHSTLLVAVPLWIACAGFLGYLLVRKVLHPVVTMSSEAAAISTADLARRIPVSRPDDEMGHLAITFNALLDRLTAALDQQRRFMAEASHELRTPLAVVRGEAEVALSRTDRPAEDLRESLSVIEQESLVLTSIIDDLFLLARADAGQRIVSPTRFYLDELVGDSVRSLRSMASKKSIHLQAALQRDSEIEADEPLVRRMVVNVIENAIKYTPPRGAVEVQLRDDGAFHQIVVRDTGVGIPHEKRALIFERFHRELGGLPMEGAGLGLSIARTIAEMHGGRIDLEASDPAGSTFRITLPHRSAAVENAPRPAASVRGT